MYNVWFGDCFRIINEDSDLIVDFGIHRCCLAGKKAMCGSKIITRDMVHDEISKRILSSNSQRNLLITHFHEDHISGLIYMEKHMKSGNKKPFNYVYIPDVWGVTNATCMISLCLLEELLKSSYISGSMKLFDLVRFLCLDVRRVIFTHRGMDLENGLYTALWPDPAFVGKEAKYIWDSLQLDQALKNAIYYTSEKLCNIVVACAEMEGENREGLMNDIDELDAQFFDGLNESYLRQLQNNTSLLKEIHLNKFGNKISIVFHNKKDNKENLLFTGDLDVSCLNKITQNDDKKIDMHKTINEQVRDFA